VPARGQHPAVGERDKGGIPAAATGQPESSPVIETPSIGLGPPQRIDRTALTRPEQVDLVVPWMTLATALPAGAATGEPPPTTVNGPCSFRGFASLKKCELIPPSAPVQKMSILSVLRLTAPTDAPGFAASGALPGTRLNGPCSFRGFASLKKCELIPPSAPVQKMSILSVSSASRRANS
jgi:hypothetical protein